VLELFRSIPEEVGSGRLVLLSGEEESIEFKSVLREKGAVVVLSLCEEAVSRSCGYRQRMERQFPTGEVINAGGYPDWITPTHHHRDVATTEAVLSCLQSWIRIVDMSPSLLQNSMLLPWIFDYLLTDSTNGGYEMAVDVAVELMRSYTSEHEDNSGLIQAIVPRVMALGGIDATMGGGGEINGNRGLSSFEKAIREEDEDGMRGYCRIFTEMGEAYLSLILSHEELNQEVLVELVLKCAGIPDKGTLCCFHFCILSLSSNQLLPDNLYRRYSYTTFVIIQILQASHCTFGTDSSWASRTFNLSNIAKSK
jgi:transportin-3